jgi:hypothetical protein
LRIERLEPFALVKSLDPFNPFNPFEFVSPIVNALNRAPLIPGGNSRSGWH